MKAIAIVPLLEDMQPLFREYCAVRGLKTGDCFAAADYLAWVEELSYAQTVEIICKYKPDGIIR